MDQQAVERIENPNFGDSTENTNESKLATVLNEILTNNSIHGNSSDALNTFFEKLRHLEVAWYANESKCTLLKTENEHLVIQLASTRNKCSLFEKRLQFIQANQDNLETLKHVYVKMKLLQEGTTSTPAITIDNFDKGTQSDSTLLASLLSAAQTTDPNSLCVKRTAIARAQDTMTILRRMVDRREKSWQKSDDRSKELAEQMKRMGEENECLKRIIRSRVKGDVCREEEEVKVREKQEELEREELASLKVMVNKLLMRNRELEIINKSGSEYNIFNKRERELLENVRESSEVIIPQESRQEYYYTPFKCTITPPIQSQPSLTQEIPLKRTSPVRQLSPTNSTKRSPSCPAGRDVKAVIVKSKRYNSSPRQESRSPSPTYSLPRSGIRLTEKNQSTMIRVASPTNSSRARLQQRCSSAPMSKSRRDDNEHSELEILDRIKEEIVKKQATISRKLYRFEQCEQKEKQRKLTRKR